MTQTMSSSDSKGPIDPHVRIGHVHLKVSDLQRSLDFYVGILGFELTQRYGTQAAFVSAGGTTTTSDSILGRVSADRRHRLERQVCTTPPFCIRPVARSLVPFGASLTLALRSTERAITA